MLPSLITLPRNFLVSCQSGDPATWKIVQIHSSAVIGRSMVLICSWAISRRGHGDLFYSVPDANAITCRFAAVQAYRMPIRAGPPVRDGGISSNDPACTRAARDTALDHSGLPAPTYGRGIAARKCGSRHRECHPKRYTDNANSWSRPADVAIRCIHVEFKGASGHCGRARAAPS